jgi:hypothetical protein
MVVEMWERRWMGRGRKEGVLFGREGGSLEDGILGRRLTLCSAETSVEII